MSDPFPDVEDVIVTLLEDDAGGADHAGTVIPTDLKDRLPFVFIYRFGGRDDRITDVASIEIDTFAATRADGMALAETLRQRLTSAPHNVTTEDGVVVVDTVSTLEAPREVPYGDSDVRRFASAFSVSLRR